MPLEIEAKVRCDDLDAIRQRLRDAGARRLGQVKETNIFFDTPERSLQRADRGLRLRVNRNLDTGHSTIVITHKGPRQAGPFKARQETELRVDDAEAAAALLEALGYARTLTFEKRRESWRLDECSIELDELPRVGSFVEIEGPTEAQVQAVKDRLGLGALPHIDTPYIAMLEECVRGGERVVRFAREADGCQ